MTTYNPFDDLLETNRDLTFLGALNRRTQSRQKRNALWGQFGQFQRSFLGRLGAQALGGQAPTLRFSDFVKNLDFDREFKMLSPRQKGRYGSGRTRHLLRF